MPRFQVTADEWKIANQYLSQAPNGTKLPYSDYLDSNNQFIPKKKYIQNPKPYQTAHSFIKLNEKIYAIAQGKGMDAIIGSGSYGRVKYAQSEDGSDWLIKICDVALDCSVKETETLMDLSLSAGGNKRQDKSKYYITIQNLGVDLVQFIKKNKSTLTDATRLDIAIELSWQVCRLHEGLASETQTPYAHNDLKPNNVTIDEANHVHLIDFGLTEKFPEKTNDKLGTYLYSAYREQGKPVTNEQNDVVALQRILFLPDQFWGYRNHHSSEKGISLLTKSQLLTTGLNPYINTYAKSTSPPPDYGDFTMAAATVCALLIAAKLKLTISYDRIKDDKNLALSIIALYFMNKANEIEETLSQPLVIKLIAALSMINKTNLIEEYIHDSALSVAMNQVTTSTMACALVHLKRMSLENHYHAVIESSELAKAIIELSKVKMEQHFHKLLQDDNKLLINAILFLEQNKLQHYYREVIDDPALCAAIANIHNKETVEAVVALLQSNKFSLFSHKDVITVCQNEQISKAITILNSSQLREYYRTAIDSPEIMKAIIHTHQRGMNNFEIAQIIPSVYKCAAINILFETTDLNREEYLSIIYFEDKAKLFLLLAKLNLSQFYRRALSDYSFGSDIFRILSSCYYDKVTKDMLSQDHIRKLLLNIIDRNPENLQAFLLLYNAGLLDKNTCAKIESSYLFYEAVNMLSTHGFERYFKTLMDFPSIAYNFYKLLENTDFSPAYHLTAILKKLPVQNRYPFILDVITADQLKDMCKNPSNWHAIKSTLDSDARAAINMLVYSEEELSDKDTLKNIKTTIKHTSFGLFDSVIGTSIGKTNVTVPEGVYKQINELQKVRYRGQSHAEAIEKIKAIGKQELQSRAGLISATKYFLFSNNATKNYFDNFESDEKFNRAFVNKK